MSTQTLKSRYSPISTVGILCCLLLVFAASLQAANRMPPSEIADVTGYDEAGVGVGRISILST